MQLKSGLLEQLIFIRIGGKMPRVSRSPQINRSSYQNRADLKKTLRPALPRDDLREAFAGNENNGPVGEDKSQQHSTSVKSRITKKSRTRTPIR